MPDKPFDIRKKKRLERSTLCADIRATLDQSIFHHLINWSVYPSVQRIAIYQALPEEASLKGLLPHAHRLNQSCYVPITPADRQGLLTFAQIVPTSPVALNQFGIEEPVAPYETIDISQLELILMPLVAFDRRGHRIGMGAGYYDRTLEACTHAPTPIRVGVAYGLQEVPSIKPEKWDVPCHYILTEHGIISCVE